MKKKRQKLLVSTAALGSLVALSTGSAFGEDTNAATENRSHGMFRPAIQELVAQPFASQSESGTVVVDFSKSPKAAAAALSKAEPALDGNFTTSFNLLGYVSYAAKGERRDWDCVQDGCQLVVSDGEEVPGTAADPIDWDEGTLTPSRPQLETTHLRRIEGLWHEFKIKGSGFAPRSEVLLVQCPAIKSEDGVADTSCLVEGGGRAVANKAGEFKATVKLAEKFQRTTGELIDCTNSNSKCLVAAPWPSKSDPMAWVDFTVPLQ